MSMERAEQIWIEVKSDFCPDVDAPTLADDVWARYCGRFEEAGVSFKDVVKMFEARWLRRQECDNSDEWLVLQSDAAAALSDADRDLLQFTLMHSTTAFIHLRGRSTAQMREYLHADTD